MIEKFISYYQSNNLFKKTDNILLAVSGGKDSMVMLHLFKQSKLSFGVAHCNFSLRGKDAIMDEQFIREFTNKNNIPFYSIAFSTKKHASEKGISIQMAARELRYQWFDKIRIENNYKYIATAHHKNDVAETMLMNLTKGTGLAGLHGIANKKNNIIRPLLCFTRLEIESYIKENNISFREDLSNSETKYTRNAIRHKIIPELEKINPQLIETLNNEANRFLNDEQIIKGKIENEKKKLFIKDGGYIKIKINELKKKNPLTSYLYYLLKEYNFNSSDINDIISSMASQSGKTFFSTSHQILKDREFLILKKIEKKSEKEQKINSYDELPFNFQIVEASDNLKINSSSKFAHLDADKIQFPIILRKWKRGDIFQPFGMKGNKKVSDFLIDKKIPVIDKEKIKVLISNSKIIWLVDLRIDDNYKITSSTKEVLILSTRG